MGCDNCLAGNSFCGAGQVERQMNRGGGLWAIQTGRWGDVGGSKMGRGTGTLAKHISQAEGPGTCTWP